MTAEGYRRAALCIRSLQEGDRQWLLERLPAAVQEKVRGALHELDTGTADQALAYTNGHDHDSDPIAAYIVAIDQAAAADVMPILTEAPDWLAACVLGYKRWSWTEFYWHALPPARRAAILQTMKQAQSLVKSKMREAIMEVLARAVMSKQAKPATNGHESFERILKTLEQEPEAPRKGWRLTWTR